VIATSAFRRAAAAIAATVLALAAGVAEVRQPGREALAAAVRARIDAYSPEPPRVPQPTRDDLDTLYAITARTVLWVDADGRPSASARSAIGLLERAADEGLDPSDYDAAGLKASAAALSGGSATIDAIAAFDVSLSAAMLRFLRHLHLGRIDPSSIGFRTRTPEEPHDFSTVLASALMAGRVAQTVDAMRPPLRRYHALHEALPRYRALVARAPGEFPVPDDGVVLRPGDRHPVVPALRERLVLLGDLPADATAEDGTLFDDALAEGVRRFQTRHTLEPDAIVGRQTWAALAMPLTWRVRQIELALERLRWLPDLGARPFVIVNIPMFRLWAWNAGEPPESPVLTMRAIVGRAMDTQTPVFSATVRQIVFRPYWNVPRSIVVSEILPAIRRDPGYLEREGMELVRGATDAGEIVEPSEEAIALLRQGRLRVRQRPGPRNALGPVKFEFPNEEHIYLHGTPAQALFARTRRDFSHGCVRVEDPGALAEWMLGLQGDDWPRARIDEAMTHAWSERVRLTRPIDVVLFYVTAVAMPDGTVHFAPDIYGHDARLDRALARLRRG